MHRIVFWVLMGTVALFVILNILGYISSEDVLAYRDRSALFVSEHYFLSAVLFFLLYVVLIAVSFPVATALTIISGSLFGPVVGLLLASAGSVTGSLVATLLARFVLTRTFEERFGTRIGRVLDMVEGNYTTALFALRLSPIFPFFIVNIAMGFTKVYVWRYILVSALGMLPATFLFVYTGSQLADISYAGDILSPGIIITMTVIAVLPICTKYLLTRMGWYTADV